jgi:catechol 2,3-dioxygenase-like lactoylglutathione lyase family enzyme
LDDAIFDRPSPRLLVDREHRLVLGAEQKKLTFRPPSPMTGVGGSRGEGVTSATRSAHEDNMQTGQRVTALGADDESMDWKLELVGVPVSDVDRAKAFYTEQLGFVPDVDQRVSDGIRFVQVTPPGSACSIAFGQGVTAAEPGSVEGLQVVVADVRAARTELVERGVDASDVQDYPWGSFVYFRDPDGNGWALQQLPERDR